VTKGARTSKHKVPRHKCNVCGKEHAGPCWEDKANAHLCLANWKSARTTGNIAVAVATTEEDGKFILSGIALKNLNKPLMPEGLKKHGKVEEEYKEEAIMPEDVEETSEDDSNAHWFLFEWVLDTYVGVENKPHVTSDLSVMSTNKNHKLSVVKQIANRYLLECKLGLKAMDYMSKITFPNV
jgi:hypothetical protein